MNYVVSETQNGKYFYKVGNDGKKARISKEEYEKKTKPRKSKKFGCSYPVGFFSGSSFGNDSTRFRYVFGGVSNHESKDDVTDDGPNDFTKDAINVVRNPAVGNSPQFWTNLPFHEFPEIWNHEL